MDIKKHQNILAVLYFAAGYFFAFTLLFTTTEIHLKACGCLCTIYYTWLLPNNYNMKTQVLLLITKIKLNLSKLMAIIFSFFLPIVGILILIGAAVLLDTLSGIYKARKLKQPITSRKLSAIMSKILLYEATVILFYLIDYFLVNEIVYSFFSIEMLVTKVLALTLVSIEVVSINENYRAIYGKDIWSALKNLFARAKEVTQDFKNIKKMKICKCCRQPIKSDSKNLYIFDNGHGGIIDGVYQTAGKRSPIWDDGSQLFEGEFNRSIVKRLVAMCKKANIDYVNLVDTNVDIPLSTRTSQANEIYRNTDKPCIYISIHANGFSDEAANGWEVYTSVGETKSDEIAEVLFNKAQAEFPTHKMRKDTRDGDADKESNFYVLKNTAMPAILSENFFMTNEAECRLLMSEEGRDRIAKIHFEMIQELER